MNVYITYRAVWCGDVLDDYSIGDIVSITDKPMNDDEILEALTAYAKKQLGDDAVVIKNKPTSWNIYEPSYTAYENQAAADDKEDEFI